MGKKKRKRRGSPKPPARKSAPQPPTEGVTPTQFRSDLFWAAGLSLLAWCHRLAFLVSNRDRSWPFTVFYEGDSRTFFQYARALLNGQVYDNGIPFHPPGFPTFLAGLHTILGAGPDATEIPHLAVKAALALVSSLSVGLLYVLARPYLGRLAAFLAAGLCVHHFGLYVIAVAPVSEGVYLTLLLTVLVIWSRKLEHPLAAPGSAASARPWSTGLLLGVLLGLLALLRAESALVSVLLVSTGLWGIVARTRGRGEPAPYSWKAALLPWVLVGVGWGLAVAPWTIRNVHRLEEFNASYDGRLAEPVPTFVPLTIYGPLNLALANHADADGTFSASTLHAGTGSGLDFTNPRHLRFVLHGDAMAWEWIRSHPSDFVRLVLRKWALCADVFKLGWTQWNWPGGLVGERRPIDVFVPDRGPQRWVLALAVALGWGVCLWVPGGPRRWAGIVILLTLAGLVTTGLFFAYVRQALLLLPFWLSLAVFGPIAAVSRMRGGEFRGIDTLPKPLALGLAALALVLLVVEGLGARADRNYRATGVTFTVGGRLNPDEAVRLEVLEPP